MTADELARSYFVRAHKRLAALRLPQKLQAYPDVVREAQEIVELSLKGMLRRDREAAFYGDIDMIPEQLFGEESARRALEDAERVVAAQSCFEAP